MSTKSASLGEEVCADIGVCSCAWSQPTEGCDTLCEEDIAQPSFLGVGPQNGCSLRFRNTSNEELSKYDIMVIQVQELHEFEILCAFIYRSRCGCGSWHTL